MKLAKHGGEREEDGQIDHDVLEQIPELSFAYLYSHSLECAPLPDPKSPNGPPEDFTSFKEYWNRQEEHARREGIPRPLKRPLPWEVVQVHSVGLLSMERLAAP